MSSKRGTPDKEEWLRKAEEAYKRVFGERDRCEKGLKPATFSEMEAEAVEEANRLARWLLEQKISAEAEVTDLPREECRCPHCGKPAKRKREDLTTREVEARPGTVLFKRYEFGAKKKAALGDGSLWIWGIVSTFLVGFVPILDFVHLVSHLYSAAQAA